MLRFAIDDPEVELFRPENDDPEDELFRFGNDDPDVESLRLENDDPEDARVSFRAHPTSTSEFVFATIPKPNCFGARIVMFARAGSHFDFSLALVFAPKQFRLRNSSL